ncbi:MAG: aminotransferase class I/II-fold pyridoxal phosphate-dependent enzyme [Defluviitaleaceae bacterium]|nr:aminotransferase class I/II-fold pyridoxal phosphate-dependent enzyme [Defluviitaleaceae bacterium]
MNQNLAPIAGALEKLRTHRIVPFDVPGHKRGKGNPDLTAFFGQRAVEVDANSMPMLDFLGSPVGVIKEAEELAATAFGASAAFLMVGGTTSSVQAMIMFAVKRGEKILMPRNIHKSALSSLILSGAEPVYIDPSTDKNLGISLGMKLADIEAAITANTDAKAIFLNNPTYYGICSDLQSIVRLAHAHNMLVLVDEAHGTHFSFSEGLPMSAMDAGADMSAVSVHKSGGSLTQSSILLTGKGVNPSHVRQIINLTQTTSASYLLLASLDISRRHLALNGKEIFRKVIDLTTYARSEINQIGKYYAFGKEIINHDSIFDFDTTKLSVNTLKTGLAGIEVYDILRGDYEIQIEYGDIGNFLAYVSIGDEKRDIERLCSSLKDILRTRGKSPMGMMGSEYIHPQVVLTPQEAFYGEKRAMQLTDSLGEISGESVMCYPPGIPVFAPGERITKEALDYIAYAREKGCSISGTQDPDVKEVLVLK